MRSKVTPAKACMPSSLHTTLYLHFSSQMSWQLTSSMIHALPRRFRRVLISDGCQMARAQVELVKISMTFVCRQIGGVCRTPGGRNQSAWRLLEQVLLSWCDLTRSYFRGHGGEDKGRNITPLSVHFHMCAGKRSGLRGLWEMRVAMWWLVFKCVIVLFLGVVYWQETRVSWMC